MSIAPETRPGMVWNDKTSKWIFNAVVMAEDLTANDFAAVDGGQHLFRYSDAQGWTPDGEDFYRAKCKHNLGLDWTTHRENEVTNYIRGKATCMDERPSLSRIRVLNGILHIGADGIKLEEPSADPMTPFMLNIRYDPKARCPRFNKFLREVLPPAALRALLQEVAGYCTTPDTRKQKAFMLIGPTGNGKSTTLNALTKLVGKTNVSNINLQLLNHDRFAKADLYGKLINIVADISADELQTSAAFREIVGQDQIRGERKHAQPFQFYPYARLIFSANRFPPMKDPTPAFFDRWIVIPFEHRSFRGTTQCDTDLLAKLTTPRELSGILNWALDGLLRLNKRGRFLIPEESNEQIATWRHDASLVAMFLDPENHPPPLGDRVKGHSDSDAPDTLPSGFEIPSVLYRKFVDWRRVNGNTGSMSSQTFNGRVREHLGLEKQRKGVAGWFFSP